jgi:hypothetical protein
MDENIARALSKWEDVEALKKDLLLRQVGNERPSSDGIILWYPSHLGRGGPTKASVQRLSGPRELVFDYVAYELQHDSCTPMYEHMLWRVTQVHFSPDDSLVEIEMYKSHYAGD